MGYDRDCPWYGVIRGGYHVACWGKCQCFIEDAKEEITEPAISPESFVSWRSFAPGSQTSWLDATEAEIEAYWLSLLTDPEALVQNDDDVSLYAMFE